PREAAGSASTTMTLRPRRVSSVAATSPESPAPITMTSASAMARPYPPPRSYGGEITALGARIESATLQQGQQQAWFGVVAVFVRRRGRARRFPLADSTPALAH